MRSLFPNHFLAHILRVYTCIPLITQHTILPLSHPISLVQPNKRCSLKTTIDAKISNKQNGPSLPIFLAVELVKKWLYRFEG